MLDKRLHSVKAVVLKQGKGTGDELGTGSWVRDETEVATLAVSPSTDRQGDLEVAVLLLKQIELLQVPVPTRVLVSFAM